MLPGDKLHADEKWNEGLKRELKEETGIEKFEIEKITDVDKTIKNIIVFNMLI